MKIINNKRVQKPIKHFFKEIQSDLPNPEKIRLQFKKQFNSSKRSEKSDFKCFAEFSNALQSLMEKNEETGGIIKKFFVVSDGEIDIKSNEVKKWIKHLNTHYSHASKKEIDEFIDFLKDLQDLDEENIKFVEKCVEEILKNIKNKELLEYVNEQLQSKSLKMNQKSDQSLPELTLGLLRICNPEGTKKNTEKKIQELAKPQRAAITKYLDDNKSEESAKELIKNIVSLKKQGGDDLVNIVFYWLNTNFSNNPKISNKDFLYSNEFVQELPNKLLTHSEK